MTTFGNPHEEYTPQTTRTNKERKKVNANQKAVKTQKKRKSRGQSVTKSGNSSPGATSNLSPHKLSSVDPEDEYEEEGIPKQKKRKKRKKPEKEENDESDENTSECIPPNVNFAGFHGLPGFAQIFVTLAALGQLVVALIHIIDLFKSLDVCNDVAGSGIECVGDSLYWEIPFVDDTSSVMNVHWRSVFTFAPSGISTIITIPLVGTFTIFAGVGFCDNWTPMVFGMLAVMQIFMSTQWHFISGTWLRTTFFIVVMMLFACFGYSGMAGIIIGFVQVIAGFLCLLCAIFKLGGTPYPTVGY